MLPITFTDQFKTSIDEASPEYTVYMDVTFTHDFGQIKAGEMYYCADVHEGHVDLWGEDSELLKTIELKAS